MQIRTVREFMDNNPVTVSSNQSIEKAAKILIDYHLSAIPVVDEGKQIVGILSEADCLRATLLGGYHNESVAIVKDLMTAEPDTMSPDTELSAATERFLNNRRRMIPIVEAGTLVGTLTRRDLLAAIAKR